MIRKEEVFKVGQFVKPHGVKGEIALTTRGDFDALEEMEDPYVVCDMDGILVPFFVESFRYKSDSVVLLKFDGLDTDEAVRSFVNKEAYLPLDAVSRDDLAGEMAWDDFVGYRVLDEENGELGTIVAVDESTVNVLFHIEKDGQGLIFPAAEELILEINPEEKSLLVSVPEGLLDLNG